VLYVTLLAHAPTPLAAQLAGGADLTYRGAYIWRGLTRQSSPVLQPDLYLDYRIGPGFIVAGIWTSFSTGSDRNHHADGEHNGSREIEPWLELTMPASDWIDVTVGGLSKRFVGAHEWSSPGMPRGTEEIYARLRTRALPVVVPQLAAYHDVGAVRGTYVEAGLDVRIPLWNRLQAPVGSIVLSGRLGSSYGMSPNAVMPQQSAYYARDGLTHLDLGASTLVGPVPVVLPLAEWLMHISLLIGWHNVNRIDPATRVDASGVGRRWQHYWEFGLSIGGPKCRPTRRICS